MPYLYGSIYIYLLISIEQLNQGKIIAQKLVRYVFILFFLYTEIVIYTFGQQLLQHSIILLVTNNNNCSP